MSKPKSISKSTKPKAPEPEFYVAEPIKYHNYAEYAAAFPDRDERYIEECTIPDDGWVLIPSEHPTEFANRVELYAVIHGVVACPICGGCGRYDITERGKTELTQNILRESRPFCQCMGWKYVVSVANKELPPLYSYVDLWTLQPSLQSILPRVMQEQELQYVRENRDGSFLILGPSGTGKSTISCALMKYAHERDFKCFWENGSAKPYGKTRWIWRANFDLLLQQYNAYNTASFEEKSSKEPYVTVDKIITAREAGHTPFLIIEEVDKTKLNEHRVKFLFQLIDTMINNNGQLILTSNLQYGDFVEALSREEEMETSQETITRRLIQRVHVRDYFRMHEKKQEVISQTK